MGSMPPPAVPAVCQAFETIGKTVLSVAAAAITFSGIDTSNRMFRISLYAVNDGSAANVQLRINNDSGGSYDLQTLSGSAASVVALRQTALTQIGLNILVPAAANEHVTSEIVIAKQQAGNEALIVARTVFVIAGALLRTEDLGAIWNNTAALISRLDLLKSAGNFAADTVALLEGNATS